MLNLKNNPDTKQPENLRSCGKNKPKRNKYRGSRRNPGQRHKKYFDKLREDNFQIITKINRFRKETFCAA